MPFLMSPSAFIGRAPLGAPVADLSGIRTAGSIGEERVIGPTRPTHGSLARSAAGRRAPPVNRRTASAR